MEVVIIYKSCSRYTFFFLDVVTLFNFIRICNGGFSLDFASKQALKQEKNMINKNPAILVVLYKPKIEVDNNVAYKLF